MNQIEKFPLDSMDIKQEQISRLKQLFPEVFTEGNKLDWEKLKLTLGEDIDVGKERFGLNWAGKSNCFKLIQQPSTGTLVPAKEESINFDSTENLFIEGDNLEVLKLLQKSYFGKVKMIYIDPPYNTGNEFVYTDDFKDNLKNYLELTGQVDAGGKKLSNNVESDGRFHSNWLNMMYPRLFLAKNLLKEDGVIFISIDDNEVHNLRALCNEIFGEENFVANIIWERAFAPINLKKHFSENHDYLLCYSKNFERSVNAGLRRGVESDARYKNLDNDERGPWASSDCTVGPVVQDKLYEIISPSGKKFLPPEGRCWLFTQSRFNQMIAENRIWFGVDGQNVPRVKKFLSEVKDRITPVTVWRFSEVGHSQSASQNLMKLFDGESVFTYPKPLGLIKKCVELYGNEDTDIILDFFAGSCTTAHAVLELNREDGGNRKFICVQIPEPTDETSEAFKAGYKNIAEIGKERIRRVIKKIETEKQKQEPGMFDGDKKPQDLGFKVFKLQSSNFATWDANVEKSIDALTQKLFQHIDHISPEAEQDAILYELLLKAGFELTTQIEKLTVADKTIYSVMENVLLICLERNLTHELLKAIAELKPNRFICLDEGFSNNDQLKSNAVLLMKENGVQKFQTV
jgi:adenine-specific DNA-methyltransferase